LGGLYSGGLIFGWAYIRGAYIWNEVSVSTCGGLIHGGPYIREGAYSRRFAVYVHILDQAILIKRYMTRTLYIQTQNRNRYKQWMCPYEKGVHT
jgi:hypothetical protein